MLPDTYRKGDCRQSWPRGLEENVTAVVTSVRPQRVSQMEKGERQYRASGPSVPQDTVLFLTCGFRERYCELTTPRMIQGSGGGSWKANGNYLGSKIRTRVLCSSHVKMFNINIHLCKERFPEPRISASHSLEYGVWWTLRCATQNPFQGWKTSSPSCWECCQQRALSGQPLSRDCICWRELPYQGLWPFPWMPASSDLSVLGYKAQFWTAGRATPALEVPTPSVAGSMEAAFQVNFSFGPILPSSLLFCRKWSQETP